MELIAAVLNLYRIQDNSEVEQVAPINFTLPLYIKSSKWWLILKDFEKNRNLDVNILVDIKNVKYPWIYLVRNMKEGPINAVQIELQIIVHVKILCNNANLKRNKFDK